MLYAKPEYDIQTVNWAGRLLTDLRPDLPDEDARKMLMVIDNWRAAHSFPLNSIYVTVNRRAKKISPAAFASQRIKRLMSIGNKLWDSPGMKLSQMQDIGGCRAILPTIDDVYALRKNYVERPVAHKFIGQKDYIREEPKKTGYRGIHLKYRFSGRGTSLPFNNLKIEIQLRTILQHTWATAVEAAGTFNDEALKSNKGSPNWLRFFALMSSVFALREGCPPIPNTPTNYADLCAEICDLNQRYYIEETFAQYRSILPHFDKRAGAKYYLVVLDPVQRTVEIRGFRKEESQEANRQYTLMEEHFREKPTTNVVLVSVSSYKALKRAYPNYFLDTEGFLREVRAITGTPIAAIA